MIGQRAIALGCALSLVVPVEAAAAEFASPDFGEELARVTAVTRRVCTR